MTECPEPTWIVVGGAAIGWIGNVVVAASAAVAAAAAWRGVDTWQRQLKGTTEFDLARKILVGVEHLKDEILTARRPRYYAEDYAERQGTPAERLRFGTELESLDAYNRRLSRVLTKRVELVADITVGRVHWKGLDEAMNRFEDLIEEFMDAVHGSFHPRPPRQEGPTLDQLKSWTKVFDSDAPDNDPDEYGQRLQLAAEGFRDILGPAVN